jgi:hypothetical protein
LHDICAKHQDFGVWRFWEELKSEFPSTFEFHHSWGLGVLRKEGAASGCLLTDYVFHSSESVREELRHRYVIYGSHLENVLGSSSAASLEESAQESADILVQVFPFGATGYSEQTSLSRTITAGTWHTLVFELPEGVGHGPLRVDPAHIASFVEIGDIEINSDASGDLLWKAPSSSPGNDLVAAGTAALLHGEKRLFLFSFGNDPQLMLNVPPDVQGAVKLTISLRVSLTSSRAPEMCDALVEAARMAMQDQIIDALRERDATGGELSQALEENQVQREALEEHKLERNKLASELARVRAENAIEHDRLLNDLNLSIGEKEIVKGRLLSAESEFRREQSTRLAMQESLSWRMTEPIRKLMNGLRSGPRNGRHNSR